MFGKKPHRNIKVGLLGGSFNPPHKGHIHVSNQAIKLLGLDETWWLVSPQNPLKNTQMADNYEERFKLCQEIAKNHPHINISGIEDELQTKYSIETIEKLTAIYPNINFIWIIGSDNLLQMPKWQKWKDIFNIIPIAIFNREPYSKDALNGQAAKFFNKNRVAEKNAKSLVGKKVPAWCFLDIEPMNISSTKIREENND